MMMRNNASVHEVLYKCVTTRNWEGVIKQCEEERGVLSVKLTQAGDTVLHLAVYDNQVDVVEKLVKLICSSSEKEQILKLKNERKNTPLHVAAMMGSAIMCQIIGSVDEKLVDERNIDGETPLFLAALYGHKMAFYCLYDFCRMDLNLATTNCRRKNGDTILHCALKNEQFDVAFQLINMNNEAATWVDGEGYTPLHVLATKPSAFQSGAHISGLQYIIYHCICVDELKAESAATRPQGIEPTRSMRIASFFPKNYDTCIAFVTNLWDGILMFITSKPARKKKEEMNSCDYNETKGPDLEKDVNEGIDIIETHQSNPPLNTQLLKRPSGHQSDTKPPSFIFPQNYDTCINFFQIFFTAIMIILEFGFPKIKMLWEEKQKHTWSVQVMERLLELSPPDKYGQKGDAPMIANLQPHGTLPYIFQGDSVGFNKEKIHDLPNNDQVDGIRKLRKEKLKNTWAVQVMNKLLELAPPDAYVFEGSSPSPMMLETDITPYIVKIFEKMYEPQIIPTKMTPMLLAAKYGVVEMVSSLLKHFPQSILDSDSMGRNVVLLAAKYRRVEVYKFLVHKKKFIETLFRATDKNGNTALHLAAHIGHDNKPWRVTGPALQLQSEIKWYRFVEDSMQNKFFVQYNNDEELAEDIFNKTHQGLLKNGQEWLVRTSESCSLLAALVTTVAFASATTVPGGNGDNGAPPLEREIGFFIFAVSSLIALCLSTTSVVAFLSILSSKFEKEDFSWKLPARLLIGLSSLFFSIVAMLVSFCAGHYFMLSYRLQNMVVVAYVVSSLPVALFFALVQIHLFHDLLVAILSNVPT